VKLDMVVGRVVVPDLPVGSVIVSRDWTMNAPGGPATAVPVPTALRRRLFPGSTDLGNKIYSTNVPGIGMRLVAAARRSISSIPTFSPPSRTTNYSLEGSRFTLEIIKTAATTGSGTLAAGKYTSYDWERGITRFWKPT
jgi:hypothetical protein